MPHGYVGYGLGGVDRSKQVGTDSTEPWEVFTLASSMNFNRTQSDQVQFDCLDDHIRDLIRSPKCKAAAPMTHSVSPKCRP